MRFLAYRVYRFVSNAIDVLRVGNVLMDSALVRAEFLKDHRIRARLDLVKLLPRHSVGAEIGVFTGLFSTILLDAVRPTKMYFVDPWWKEFGSHYPDWGLYTDHGKLSTATAHRAACRRIERHTNETKTEILVDYSTRFLPNVPDNHLDWTYLDSTHSYEGTCAELARLRTKVKSGGIVAGDDWHDDAAHPHGGVAKAVKEAVEREEYELVAILPALQWAIRVP
jgi:hypothetical protein